MWQEGRVSCSAWAPAPSIHHLHAQGAELQPQDTVWGRRWQHRCTWSSLNAHFCISGLPTDRYRRGLVGPCYRKRFLLIGNSQNWSYFKRSCLFCPLLAPHPPNTVTVVALGFQHKATAPPRTFLEVTCVCTQCSDHQCCCCRRWHSRGVVLSRWATAALVSHKRSAEHPTKLRLQMS